MFRPGRAQSAVGVGNRPKRVFRTSKKCQVKLPVGAGWPALGGCGEKRARIVRGGKQHHALNNKMKKTVAGLVE